MSCQLLNGGINIPATHMVHNLQGRLGVHVSRQLGPVQLGGGGRVHNLRPESVILQGISHIFVHYANSHRLIEMGETRYIC